MAHDNVKYVSMPNAGNLRAPAGQTYHVPPISLRGYISSRHTNHQSISDHKVSIGIPDDNQWYSQWWEAVKEQIVAWGIRKIRTFPDIQFQQIFASMRTLRPACDRLVTAVAANDLAGMWDIDEAVVLPGKDCGVKLRTTIRNRSKGAPQVGQQGVPCAQIMLSDQLLLRNASD